jgi:hypothetical protein
MEKGPEQNNPQRFDTVPLPAMTPEVLAEEEARRNEATSQGVPPVEDDRPTETLPAFRTPGPEAPRSVRQRRTALAAGLVGFAAVAGLGIIGFRAESSQHSVPQVQGPAATATEHSSHSSDEEVPFAVTTSSTPASEAQTDANKDESTDATSSASSSATSSAPSTSSEPTGSPSRPDHNPRQQHPQQPQPQQSSPTQTTAANNTHHMPGQTAGETSSQPHNPHRPSHPRHHRQSNN